MTRNLIRKCCICGLVYGKQPLPENYTKTGISKLDKGDLVTHGICEKCIDGVYKENKLKREP